MASESAGQEEKREAGHRNHFRLLLEEGLSWSGREPNTLFQNRGDGTFDEVGDVAGLYLRLDSRGAAAADLDGDGDLDIGVANGDFDGNGAPDLALTDHYPDWMAVTPNLVSSCAADTNGDGEVGVDDLVQVIVDWGPCPGCAADLNGDGVVDVNDLNDVILQWGPCMK